MGVVSLKQHPSANLASDVRVLFHIVGRRGRKLFGYGFMLAFVVCSAYIAFCPAGEGFPWFNEFLTTATAPNRSQFSSFVSQIFPASSSTSPSKEDASRDFEGGVLGKNGTKDGDFGKNQTTMGTGPRGNGGFVNNQTTSGSYLEQGGNGGGVLPGNLTRQASGFAQRGDSTEEQVSSEVESEILRKNRTNSWMQSGDPAKTQKPGSKSAKEPETFAAERNHEEGDNKSTTTEADRSTAPVTATESSSPKGYKLSPIASSSSANGKSSAPSPVSSNGDGKRDWSLEAMRGCDIFDGTWVKDESYPLYREGSCPHIDESFNCFRNRRPDRSYLKLRWQPAGCNIPRLNATDMLERLRGKRLVFVGDSLNRNMWESLVCILRNSVKEKKKVLEASGRHEFRTEGSYSFLFKDYGCTLEFFRSPFLVQEWEMPETNGTKRETLRLDVIERSSSRYRSADIIVFNTGHWWTHEKTSKGKDYYQEGDHVYTELNVVDAFHKALNTWAKWVDAKINPKKSLVFFRGYSASHFKGGRWNSGGQCHKETQPIKNDKYLSSYPSKMNVLESVLKAMKTPVLYLNITRMTDYRKDGHPSVYRRASSLGELDQYQDCSHWCLPGVPDSWNELLYAQLLIQLQDRV